MRSSFVPEIEGEIVNGWPVYYEYKEGKMQETKIEPHKITKPIQLLAVWLAGLVLLVGAFLVAACTITNPPWLPAILVIATIVMVPIFIGLIFLMQTKFRTQLQDDHYYSEYLQRQDKEFKHFRPENIHTHTSKRDVVERIDESWEGREQRRIKRYKDNRGLFLVHTWRPSHTPGQVVDIAITLSQHDKGPLSKGKVKSVEYHLGQKFFDYTVVKTNDKDNFRLDVSAYGPMLCLARVNFNDGTPSLDLERYINF